MANSITGDFEAVLQISGGTINRLMATLHQNAFANPNLPSFPHSVKMRLGDGGTAIDGVRGLVHCQIGAPRVELVHLATHHFILDVPVRAWFRPDAGSAPLPAFINGVVRAQYRIEDIDPKCAGWGNIASQYLWVRVVRDTVRFAGTTADDAGDVPVVVGAGGPPPLTPAQQIAAVERQIAGLLVQRFAATPHPIASGFRRDRIRSLNAAPLGGSAVAVGVTLGGGKPPGNIASVGNIVLEGHDIALGVSIDHLLGLAQPVLDQVATFDQTIPISFEFQGLSYAATYQVQVDPAVIDWLPLITPWQPDGAFGIITVRFHGTATTTSDLPNATFDVIQPFTVQFDAGAQTLVISADSGKVIVNAKGLGSEFVVKPTGDAVRDALQATTDAATPQMQAALDKIPLRISPVVDQLHTLDGKASVTFTRASFRTDGIVLMGSVRLSPRHQPVVAHDRLSALDGYSALESWIPGGTVTRFDWKWMWAASALPGDQMAFDDRFILRRPRGKRSRWAGAVSANTPLPGLDGYGSMCLQILGEQVDPVTGELVPLATARVCRSYGLVVARPAGGRLLVRDVPKLAQDVPFPQLALTRVDGAGDAANTLVVFAGERWSDDTAAALRDGVQSSRRYDAGLSLLVLFQDGVLQAYGPRMFAEVERFVRGLGLASIVNEDVQESWSRAYGVRGRGEEPAWVLLAPSGAVSWRHQGRLDAQALGRALDASLRPSGRALPGPVSTALSIGVTVTPGMLNPAQPGVVEPHCPPMPVGRGSILTFVRKDDGASVAHLRELYGEHGQGGGAAPLVVMVVDGADAREAQALKTQAGVDFVPVGDARGAVTDRFGVGTWPTTVTVDERGTVSDVRTGVKSRQGQEAT